jgi:hypothetical protein
MAHTAQVLHLAESPNDSFLLKAELADEGIPCQLLALTPGEDLARAVAGSTIDLLIVDVPLNSPAWRGGLDEIQRTRPELPVVFRWGGTGNWSTESSSEQLGRRIRGVLSLPDTARRTEGERREFLDRLVRHQQTYLELLRSDFWSFDEAIKRIIERAADLLEVERVSVWEFTDDRKAIVCLDLFVRSTRSHERPRPVSSCPSYLATLESSLTLAADDAQRDPRTSELAESYLVPHGVLSMLDAPIRRDGRLVGVVCHEQTGTPRQWAVLEQCSAGWVAGLVARAMDVRERRQLAERLERAERLDSIGRLASGRYKQTLVGNRLRVNLSPDLSIASYVQYDTDSRSLGANTRLRWTFRPVADLFVVYNHNIRSLVDRWQLDSNQLVVKLQYAWRL